MTDEMERYQEYLQGLDDENLKGTHRLAAQLLEQALLESSQARRWEEVVRVRWRQAKRELENRGLPVEQLS